MTGTGKAGTSGGMPGSVAFTYGNQDWLRQFANDRGDPNKEDGGNMQRNVSIPIPD